MRSNTGIGNVGLGASVAGVGAGLEGGRGSRSMIDVGLRSFGVGLWVLGVVVGVVLGCLVFGVGVAGASGGGGVWWGLSSGLRPSVLVRGGVGEVVVTAENLGVVGSSGGVVVSDVLPVGLSAVGIKGVAGGTGADERGPVSCSLKSLSCSYGLVGGVEVLPPFETIEVRIAVVVSNAAKVGEVNRASVSGGGAVRVVEASGGLRLGASQVFGVEDYSLVPEEVGGFVDTQAGSHPFQLSTTVTFDNEGVDAQGRPVAVGLPRDVVDELPAGFIGNPTPFAQCTDQEFATEPVVESEFITNECPAASAVGVATVKFTDPQLSFTTSTVPIFNVTPRPGEPARFGFKAVGIVSAFLDTSIRTGSDYGVTVTSENISELASVLSVRLTFWGVPGDPRHDASRGWECMYHFGSCLVSTGVNPPPFLVMPTSCERPFRSTLRVDSWPAEGNPSIQAEPVGFEPSQGVDGCVRLPFEPEIRVSPDVRTASTSTGLNVDVHVPQDSVLNSESLAESAVRDITVALPEGVAVNPSGGDGLEACSEGLVGFTGFAGEPSSATFTSRLPVSLEPGVNFCADASKIATVRIATPLLPKGQDVTGAVYLATQNANPFGSLLAMYIVAEDPVSGALVKLPGEVRLSETGQLVTTFKSNPQLAFEDAELHFFGGERAPLATPARCGAYSTQAVFTPWSGNEPVQASSTFDITSGPNHTPCPQGQLAFSPSLTAGTLNIQAGSFSPFSSTIGREDGQQDMQSVQLSLPAGLSGLLSGVTLCPEEQANDGSCPQSSLIGETTVSAGVGSDPVTVKGGKVYITEKYRGAPFGLSIVNPVKAGPFDLENDTANPNQQPACDCIVVRATIEVDPHTAALTVSTDPTGPHSIPHLIDGIPVQIRKVNVTTNKPEFTFNPTNCTPKTITATITSDENTSTPLAVPFQAANCATLAFAPKLTVQTTSKTSKLNGASLNVKLDYPKAPFGSQANISYVKVELPRQLPSRLETLQQACTAQQFQTNPAGCPPASIVGHASAITPLIPVPLQGPAYFVSNGSQEFPNLIMILQGYGVTIQLVGDTFIKNGITSSTFKTVPDAPVSTFNLTLPQGRYSALGAFTNLCTQNLTMPTLFKAQNGAQKQQTTKITVTGCKPITLTHHTTHHHKLTLTIKQTQPGTLTITSPHLHPYHKTLNPGTHQITLTPPKPHHPTHTNHLHITLQHNHTTTTLNTTLTN